MQNEITKFKRTGRVGLSILDLEKDQSYYLRITGYDTKFSKKHDKDVPYFTVVDMESGEESMLWVDGGLKGQFSALGGVEAAVGGLFEIIWRGQKEIEFADEKGKAMTGKVNKYDIFAIAEA